MVWTWTNTNALDDILTPAWGDEVKNGIKQLANDVYITPANGGDGAADLAYPLQLTAPIYTGSVSGNSTTGVTVTLPASYSPAAATDYHVHCTWQGNPGGNGAIWVEKTTTNFVIKHGGALTGVVIAYTIVRKTA